MSTINAHILQTTVYSKKEHVLIWSVYLVYDILSRWLYGEDSIDPFVIIPNLAFAVLTFYWFALHFYREFFLKGALLKSFLHLVLFIFFYIALKAALARMTLGNSFVLDDKFIISESWRMLYFGLLGYGFWMAKMAIMKEKETNFIEKQLLWMDLGNSQNHFTPHFLFGVLNNLFGNIRKLNKDSAKTILDLADVLRYSMQCQNTHSNWDQEIRFLKKFIKLNTAISSGRHYVSLDTKQLGKDSYHLTVPGMTLITLVENIYKYGLVTDKNHPVRIEIKEIPHRDRQATTVRFQFSNLITDHPQNDSLGTGLKKLDRLLRLHYGQHAKLAYGNEETRFNVRLDIQYEIE